MENLVLCVVLHEVDARTDVGARHEFEGESAAAGRDTVGTGVVGSLEGAVGDTLGTSWAVTGVPEFARVAVGVTTDVVDPTPVSIEGDGRVLGGASAGSTFLPADGRMVFCSGGTNLLSKDSGGSEGEEDQAGRDHCEKINGEEEVGDSPLFSEGFYTASEGRISLDIATAKPWPRLWQDPMLVPFGLSLQALAPGCSSKPVCC